MGLTGFNRRRNLVSKTTEKKSASPLLEEKKEELAVEEPIKTEIVEENPLTEEVVKPAVQKSHAVGKKSGGSK